MDQRAGGWEENEEWLPLRCRSCHAHFNSLQATTVANSSSWCLTIVRIAAQRFLIGPFLWANYSTDVLQDPGIDSTEFKSHKCVPSPPIPVACHHLLSNLSLSYLPDTFLVTSSSSLTSVTFIHGLRVTLWFLKVRRSRSLRIISCVRNHTS